MVYAPWAGMTGEQTKLQVQAGRLKEAVTKAQALASTTPQWGAMFWQAVKNEKDLHELEPGIGNILQSHGYVGQGTIGPPRAEELKKTLQELETFGTPLHGTGGTFLRVLHMLLQVRAQSRWRGTFDFLLTFNVQLPSCTGISGQKGWHRCDSG